MVPSFEDMVVQDLLIPGTRQWDYNLIVEVFNSTDSDKILRTTPAPGEAPDKVIWHFDRRGSFTVKSAYHLAMRIIDETQFYEESAWKMIWRFKVPPKIRVFYWRLCKGWLAVKARIASWYSGVSSLCPFCSSTSETSWHLFVKCDFVRCCWGELQLWEKIDELCYEVDSACDMFLKLIARCVGEWCNGEGYGHVMGCVASSEWPCVEWFDTSTYKNGGCSHVYP